MSTSEEEQALCELCGEPMPAGEEMFKYHGFSGPCPKPPKPQEETWHDLEYARKFCYEHLPIPYLQMPEFIEQCSRLVILYAEKVSDDRRTRESGGAVSADSGKPDAGEWAERIRLSSMLVRDLADFQREILLWAAQQVRHKRGLRYSECLTPDCELDCVRCQLERLAESCGRK